MGYRKTSGLEVLKASQNVPKPWSPCDLQPIPTIALANSQFQQAPGQMRSVPRPRLIAGGHSIFP